MRMRLLFSLLLLLPIRPVSAEMMYAAACYQLLAFDSAEPETILHSVDLSPARCLESIDVDPRNGTLYGRWYTECYITCPPLPRGVVRINPATGETTDVFLDPDLSLPYWLIGDLDVDPASGEIRSAGYLPSTNLHLDVASRTVVVDTAFAPHRDLLGLAFAPDGEALALASRPGPSGGFDLLRLGGVGGSPPPSSGLLTPVAEVTGPASPYLLAFDISPSGTAYYSAVFVPSATGVGAGEGQLSTSLFSFDRTTGESTLLGAIPRTANGFLVTGIAVAVPRGAVAIPALDRTALALLALVLGTAGASLLARRRRA